MDNLEQEFFSSEGHQRNLAALAKHFPEDIDDQTAILKCHLLSEQNLRDFCYVSVPNPNFLKAARLQFNHISSLARALLTLPEDVDMSWIWGALKLLNDLRNRYAHELDPDQLAIDERIQKFKDLLSGIVDQEEVYRGLTLPLRTYLGLFVGALSTCLYCGVEFKKRQQS